MNQFSKLIIFGLTLIIITSGHTAPNQPRIGLVLSGGGARGAAHIGVLKVLERLHVPIHVIAGTSMGALVGGVYASGMPLDEMERRLTEVNWDTMFTDDPPRPTWPIRRKRGAERPTWDFSIGWRNGEFWLPKGFISGQKIQLFLTDLVKNAEYIQNYDDLPIPFRAIATNLENGQIQIFDSGPLSINLRASMSVPGFFTPVEYNDKLYVDGGLVRNLPVDIARSMGADVIIAVNLGGSYLKREQLGNILGITGQMITILTEQNVQRSLAELNPNIDILITPDLGDIESTNFARVKDAIPTGETAAQAVAGQLSRYQISPKAYASWQHQRQHPNKPQPIVVDNVQIQGLNQINPHIFNPLIQHQDHFNLNRQLLEQDIQKIYSTGDFERISYQLKRHRQQSLLIVDALEKTWGPGYISFGLGLMDDNRGDSRFGLRANYRQTWINQLGAEWNTDLIFGNIPEIYSEFYQPLFTDRMAFIAPYLNASVTPLHIYSESNRIARYSTKQIFLGVDFGLTLNKNTELRIGPYWQVRQFDLDTGSPTLPEANIQDTGLQTRIFFDNLDSGYVPRHGQRFKLEYQYVNQISNILSTGEYQRLYGSWQGAYSFGQDSIMGIIRAGSSLSTTLPYYDQFALGGFLNLSGYANAQFRSSEMLYASLALQRRVAILPSPLGRGIYLGSSIEVGRLWSGLNQAISDLDTMPSFPKQLLYGASLFLAADTWLGPIYLGWGVAGTGDNGFYLLIGQ
ncbi:patatin [Achromatium sp. WMS2]|nr:patatin [Achromatium sp. WMS2]